MTLKHIGFQDSEIMRAFEQIAQKKGLIKNNPLEKIASSQSLTNNKQPIDIRPSNDLMDNILKLASSLRTQNMQSEADELEVNYMNYKKAQTLYQTSKETGDDFLHSAHPNGSHKLDGVDADEAVVEDLIDRHLKMLKVIEKKPSGKLSNASSILGAVKLALGQDQQIETSQDDIVANAMKQIASNLSKINQITKQDLDLTIETNFMNPILRRTKDPTEENIQEIQTILEHLKSRLNPKGWQHYMTLGYSGLPQEKWDLIQGLLTAIDTAAADALKARIAIVQEKSSKLVTQELSSTKQQTEHLRQPESFERNKVSDNISKYNLLLQQVKSTLTSISYTINADPNLQKNPDKKEKANAFISGMLKSLQTDIAAPFDSAADANKESAAIGLIPILEEAQSRINEFKKQFINRAK